MKWLIVSKYRDWRKDIIGYVTGVGTVSIFDVEHFGNLSKPFSMQCNFGIEIYNKPSEICELYFIYLRYFII